MNLHQLFLTNNACYKAGVTMSPKGIMVHSTGANNPWLRRYVGPDDGLLGTNSGGNHWNTLKPGGISVCVHAFIGKLADGTVATYQTLPWNMVGWHSGRGIKGSANNMGYIGFEICEDALGDPVYFSAVYQEAVELCAMLCKEHGLDPATQIICHSEGNTLGVASNHADVMHWFPRHGKNMDTFRAAVAAEIEDDMTKDQVIAIIKEHEADKAAQEPSDWSEEARTWAEGNGVIAGDGSGNMQYKSACTREQMVVFLYRLFNLIKLLFGK